MVLLVEDNCRRFSLSTDDVPCCKVYPKFATKYLIGMDLYERVGERRMDEEENMLYASSMRRVNKAYQHKREHFHIFNHVTFVTL